MIERTDRDDIATLRLAHGKASAFDLELMDELQSQLRALRSGDTRAVILTGTGSIFSAGVDLFRLTRDGRDYAQRFVPALSAMLETLFYLPLPVVSAVNGHAIAGGCILNAASDYRLMASGTGRIGVPELLVGVPFPSIALEILRFSMPKQHIEELVYTGRTILPDEALEKGLVDEVVAPDKLLDRAMEMATQFAKIPTNAFRSTKHQLRAPITERVRRFAQADEKSLEIWSSEDTHEHIRGYLERTIKKH
jgi:enoyl-CoA hydratase